MPQPFVWDVDPVLARVGPLSVRYYGLCFGLALLTGYTVWYRRARRFGESPRFAESFLWYGVAGVILGGRLGHCFFYRPLYYLAHPLRIVAIWDGGVASHGVALGVTIALWAFARRRGVPLLRLGDYLVPAVALGVNWVRIGNFFNSEIVGHAAPAGLPWAVVFARHDLVPRHPVQLYEALMGPATWLVLHAVERRDVRPIGSGLLGGTFLVTYFGLRFYMEQYKDFMIEQLRTMAPFSTVERLVGAPIHTGQWLSLVPIAAGLALVVRALRGPRPLRHAPRAVALAAVPMPERS